MTGTDLSGTAAAFKVSRRAGFGRLLASLGIANGALSALYAGVGTVLLPQQVEDIDRAHKVAALGVVAGVSAAFALVFNPVGGALSDRTRSRFGRRAPWLACAPAGIIIMLAALGQARSVLLILVAWCLGQAAANLYQAPLTAVIPDRVPAARRGTASAVTGVAAVLGGVAGVGLASLFTTHLAAGYLLLGALLLVTALYFVAATADPPATRAPGQARPRADPRTLRGRVADFGSALRHRDFALVFASRFASILGYFLVVGYELYVLTDYIRLPAGLRPAGGVTVLAAISAVGALLAAAIAGPLSDRLDRRKPFVFASSAVAGAGCILPVLSPRFATMEIFAAFAGVAFGTYLSVDAALVTLVLPRTQDAARDLGVLNIANAGPQVLAPLFAALIIGHLGGYRVLFIAGGCCGLAGALAVMPVRSVR
ncbi:MAG TPA: MFS transporter [Streptosporangiaceae bacterium]|nr:MFS transporter [Streptosporangiaceae bacterium]